MPYSWDDQHDFDADSGKGYSFHDARKSYDDVAAVVAGGKVVHTFRNPFLTTDSLYPIIVGVDTTGSMSEWPKIFFEKLPLLYKEAIKYFPQCEISFQAINDYHADGPQYALQPAPFGRGAQLDELIGQLYPYGGGGGQTKESYEIFAAYNSFLKAPKAVIKPVAIILGDEAPFDQVPLEVCRHYGLIVGEEPLPAKEAFRKLHATCDVFLVRKPYYGFGEPDEPIMKIWREMALVPRERILNIEEPRRVVDVILGILGILTGKAELFEQELKERQDASQVKEVLNSLHDLKGSIHSVQDPGQASMSQGISSHGPKSRRLDLDS